MLRQAVKRLRRAFLFARPAPTGQLWVADPGHDATFVDQSTPNRSQYSSAPEQRKPSATSSRPEPPHRAVAARESNATI